MVPLTLRGAIALLKQKTIKRHEGGGKRSSELHSKIQSDGATWLMWLKYLRSIKSQKIIWDFNDSVGCLANACASISTSLGQAGKFDLRKEALG